MPERIIILIYKDNEYITHQDVSGFRVDQIDANIAVKKEYGFNCWIRRYPADYDIQGEV